MSGVELKDRKGAKDLMLMSRLNGTTDNHMAMANSVCSHGHVLRMALDIEVECQRKKWKQKRTLKKHDGEESMTFGLSREDVLCQSEWIVDAKQITTRLR